MITDKEGVSKEVQELLESNSGPKMARFALACLSGAIPIAGGVLGGFGSAWSEKEQERFNKVFISWLKLQEEEVKEIGITLAEIMVRLDSTDEKIKERIESREYLSLIKKCFRDWSAAESEYKRILIRNLLVNAASTEICSDDVIRLFIEWISKYSEIHFKVVKEVYNNSGITRKNIWDKIYSKEVREDSAEADLFKNIIYELSTGHVIRQHREKDYYGNFIKSPRSQTRNESNQRMTSAFDDDKKYELTELGKWLVHYTMNEIVPKITAGNQNK